MAKRKRKRSRKARPAPAPPGEPTPRVDAGPGSPLLWSGASARVERIAHARWALPAVLAIGLALRVAHLIALYGSPFFKSLVLDAGYYDAWAQRIAGGEWIGHSAFWVDPLYAYVLGILYRFGGHNLLLPRLFNIACGVATGYLVARIAERVWQSRAAALIAALAWLAFVPGYYFEGQVEKTAFTILLVVWAVELFLRFTARAALASGIVTGFAALARGNALLLVPFALACLAFGWHDAAPERQERLRRAALFLCGVVPVIALATAHNALAAGRFVPTTTNLGINLYLGNHAGNAHGYYTPPPFLHPDTGAEVPDFRAEAERRTGRALADADLSAYWRGQAWQEIAAAPGMALGRAVDKLELALHNDEAPDNEDVTLVADWSPVLRSPLFWVGQLLPLGALGLALGRRRRGVLIVAATAGVYLLGLLPFFVMARLRIQMVPLLCVLAGGALVALGQAVLAKRRRDLLVAAAIAAPLLLVTYYRPPWMAEARRSSLAVAWNNLGSSLLDAGKQDDALRAYQHAVEIDDAAVPASLRVLGRLYRDRGDFTRAEASMRRVLELKPNSPSAKRALQTLYQQMLADPRYKDDAALRERARALDASPAGASPAAALREARALSRAGRYEDAIRVLEDAVRRGPYDEGLHYTLGETMAAHASPDAMIRFFTEELPRDDKPQTSHYFLAVAHERQGDLDGAIAELSRALELDPAHEMSQREWGLVLEKQGHPEQALEHLIEATRIHPDFKAAFEDAARVARALGKQADAAGYERRAAAANPNTIRRFVYWARYLHEHGRDQAALPEVERMLAVAPTDPEALALRNAIRAALAASGTPAPPGPAGPLSASPLSGAARAGLVAALARAPAASTWIEYDGREPGARELGEALADAFKAAHWTVEELRTAAFPVKPGLFVFVAEDESPATRAVTGALDAAALHYTVGTGYRAWSEDRRRADPDWRGVTFAPAQAFVILVGRTPG